jgi:hypothetical protein
VPAPHPQVGGFAAEYPTEYAALELLASGLPEAERWACVDRLVMTLAAEPEAPAWVRAYLDEQAGDVVAREEMTEQRRR